MSARMRKAATRSLRSLSRRQFLQAAGMAALLAHLPGAWVGRVFASDAPEMLQLRIGIIALTDCSSGVVFQTAALLPWLTVRDNVLLAIESRTGARSIEERWRLAEDYLTQVGLAGIGDSLPEEISAGMRQRVGIARAFAVEPQVLLLDEPFSLLDALTRFELQEELLRLCERTNKTVVMVTRDVDEALLLADRIVMMTNGPAATIGGILPVPLPRPRTRAMVLEHPAYYPARDHLLRFLESGISPPEDEKGDEDEEIDRTTVIHAR